jgi:hypothetical protein
MSIKIFSTVEKLNADDVRVRQLSGDTDGIIAAYYDKEGDASLYMSGASATLGYVGIKTETPNEALTVAGNVSANGTVYANDIHAPCRIYPLTASYTITYEDVNTIITIDSSSATTLSIPANSAVPLPVGTKIDVIQLGTGQITVDGNGYDLSSSTGYMKTADQHSVITLYKINDNEWILGGDLSKN